MCDSLAGSDLTSPPSKATDQGQDRDSTKAGRPWQFARRETKLGARRVRLGEIGQTMCGHYPARTPAASTDIEHLGYYK